VSILLLAYTAVFTPFQIAFLSDYLTLKNIPRWAFVFMLDRMVDFVFTFDLVINFRCAWYDKNDNNKKDKNGKSGENGKRRENGKSGENGKRRG
jgi:hypothetical protein